MQRPRFVVSLNVYCGRWNCAYNFTFAFNHWRELSWKLSVLVRKGSKGKRYKDIKTTTTWVYIRKKKGLEQFIGALEKQESLVESRRENRAVKVRCEFHETYSWSTRSNTGKETNGELSCGGIPGKNLNGKSRKNRRICFVPQHLILEMTLGRKRLKALPGPPLGPNILKLAPCALLPSVTVSRSSVRQAGF